MEIGQVALIFQRFPPSAVSVFDKDPENFYRSD
jgi:hypothetical protein